MQDTEVSYSTGSAVDTGIPPLEEGLHFVVPFQDTVVNMEVRTLKFVKDTSSASKDLQTVSTEVTVNYRASPNCSPHNIQGSRITI